MTTTRQASTMPRKKRNLISVIEHYVKDCGYTLLSQKVSFAHAIWYDNDAQVCMLTLTDGCVRLDGLHTGAIRLIAKDIIEDACKSIR